MTLILSALTSEIVVQACDRLVHDTHTRQELDHHANKTVVVEPRDGIIVISYTGLAEIDGQPTDRPQATDGQAADRPTFGGSQPIERRTEDKAAQTPLFKGTDGETFHRRWSDIQASFVDEPRGAVEQADGLVAEVMQRLAQVFAEERRTLEQQWDRGGEADRPSKCGTRHACAAAEGPGPLRFDGA